MSTRALYLIVTPVVGVFDAEGRLLRELEGTAQKLYHPFDGAALMAWVEQQAREHLAGETPAEEASAPVE